jgi:AcrR family transcriptional regulator
MEVTRPTRRYRSPRRAAGAAATRVAVVAAFAAQLGERSTPELDLPRAAADAGVSLRTVYLHFPDAPGRLAAVADWAEQRLGPLPPIAGVDDLAAHVRRSYAAAAAQPSAARALRVAAAADEPRQRRLRARHLEIAALLTGIGAPPGPTAQATAVAALLASPETYVALQEVFELAPDDAADAAAHAVTALVEDLRARRRAWEDAGRG